MDQATIDANMQQLLDRNEIADLVSRLGASLDEGRFDELRSLLVDDVTASTLGGTREGRDAVVGLARRNHRPEWGSEHVITNLLVDLDGDRARVRANLVVYSAPDGSAGSTDTAGSDGPPLPPLPPKVTYTLGEVYRFELVRTAQGWRFSQVNAIPIWHWGTRPVPV